MNKTAVFISIYNKDDLLPNCLYSIAKQKLDFPIEFCIVDDCSKNDPYPIITKFLDSKLVKYKRLEKHEGFIYAQSRCFDLVSPDVDVIILQSADVILTYPDCYKILVKEVEPRTITLSCVVDIPIDSSLWKSGNYDNAIKVISDKWESYIKMEEVDIDGDVYRSSTLYSGRPGCSWLFFAGAIMKEDLISLGYDKGGCDAVLNYKMRKCGFRAKLFPALKVIHQRHKKTIPLCPIMDTCSVHCIRKTERWRNWNKDRLKTFTN